MEICFWWRPTQGQVVASQGEECHKGLFPPHYFHGLISRDEMGRYASCLISIGGCYYFSDLFRLSDCLSLIHRGLSGSYDDDVNYFPQRENKIDCGILLMSFGYLLLRDKKPSTYYMTGNLDTLSQSLWSSDHGCQLGTNHLLVSAFCLRTAL